MLYGHLVGLVKENNSLDQVSPPEICMHFLSLLYDENNLYQRI
jgi:hypothetical protein